eukprot:TRINITY_DN29531_c0_g1_i1.p1 TRINITY_DN29531_c0_g1~~TRINITY_DN29531_c0_g1_i1.p1  ORF type:complete len:296 (-),score=33.51 TRINITY_DN29531_c0_g1_i1:34-921(-)
MALWHGVFIMVVRAIVASTGKNMQRYGQRSDRPNPLLNASGILLKMLSAPLDIIAYGIAPQATLAPVSMSLGCLLDFAAALQLHGESVLRRDLYSNLLVFAGTSLCLRYGPREGGIDAPSQSAWFAYSLIVFTLCSVFGAAAVALRHRPGQLDAFVLSTLGGILGSVTVVASKVAMTALWDPNTDLLGMALALIPSCIAVPLHLYVLNRGFGRHSLVLISPVGGAVGLLSKVATGFTLYAEAPLSPFWFCNGVTTLCIGVLSFVRVQTLAKTAPKVDGDLDVSAYKCLSDPRLRL